MGNCFIDVRQRFFPVRTEFRKQGSYMPAFLKNIRKTSERQKTITNIEFHEDGITRTSICQEGVTHMVQQLQRLVEAPCNEKGTRQALLGTRCLDFLLQQKECVLRLLIGIHGIIETTEVSQGNRPVLLDHRPISLD